MESLNIYNDKPPAGLYLVSTPIGHLRDITLRALDILSSADIVMCEDTRQTSKLLKKYGISTKLSVYHDHSSATDRAQIVDMIANGKVVAMVSDAGTPLVSDPGFKLVGQCLKKNISVIPLPGANALLPALQLSGFGSDMFSFIGFLPPKDGARKTALASFVHTEHPLIFYETAPRLLKSLSASLDVLGNRRACVIRELTKIYEERKAGTLSDLVDFYETHGQPKGEIVVVIDKGEKEQWDDSAIKKALADKLNDMPLNQAVKDVTAVSGRRKNDVYDMALAVKKDLE